MNNDQKNQQNQQKQIQELLQTNQKLQNQLQKINIQPFETSFKKVDSEKVSPVKSLRNQRAMTQENNYKDIQDNNQIIKNKNQLYQKTETDLDLNQKKPVVNKNMSSSYIKQRIQPQLNKNSSEITKTTQNNKNNISFSNNINLDNTLDQNNNNYKNQNIRQKSNLRYSVNKSLKDQNSQKLPVINSQYQEDLQLQIVQKNIEQRQNSRLGSVGGLKEDKLRQQIKQLKDQIQLLENRNIVMKTELSKYKTKVENLDINGVFFEKLKQSEDLLKRKNTQQEEQIEKQNQIIKQLELEKNNMQNLINKKIKTPLQQPRMAYTNSRSIQTDFDVHFSLRKNQNKSVQVDLPDQQVQNEIQSLNNIIKAKNMQIQKNKEQQEKKEEDLQQTIKKSNQIIQENKKFQKQLEKDQEENQKQREILKNKLENAKTTLADIEIKKQQFNDQIKEKQKEMLQYKLNSIKIQSHGKLFQIIIHIQKTNILGLEFIYKDRNTNEIIQKTRDPFFAKFDLKSDQQKQIQQKQKPSTFLSLVQNNKKKQLQLQQLNIQQWETLTQETFQIPDDDCIEYIYGKFTSDGVNYIVIKLQKNGEHTFMPNEILTAKYQNSKQKEEFFQIQNFNYLNKCIFLDKKNFDFKDSNFPNDRNNQNFIFSEQYIIEGENIAKIKDSFLQEKYEQYYQQKKTWYDDQLYLNQKKTELIIDNIIKKDKNSDKKEIQEQEKQQQQQNQDKKQEQSQSNIQSPLKLNKQQSNSKISPSKIDQKSNQNLNSPLKRNVNQQQIIQNQLNQSYKDGEMQKSPTKRKKI